LHVLEDAIRSAHGSALLPVEGGWSAVLRVPRLAADEDLALELLGRGVLVHPGYFFDFDRDGFLVVSLLTDPATFAEGMRRIVETLGEQ
ncbi:MAG: pyridoxal phosphate-dependent aminotransferase, partial [Thermoanaerobaculia bacterium]